MPFPFFDQATFREATRGPGQDTRQWCSYGIVDDDTPEARSVRFTDDEGNPLPTGPLVTVTLEPSGISVPCRVAHHVAGDGEAEWMPYVAGDEVFVLIPEGDERAGCVIVGRLNQSRDVFPLTVAGQDVTKNNFGLRRLRVPYVIETAAAYSIRQASTGAQITIDPTGNLFLSNGDGHSLVLNTSGLKLGTADDLAAIQIDPSKGRMSVAAELLQVSLTGRTPAYHLATIEGVLNLLVNLLPLLPFTVPIVPGPVAQALVGAALPLATVPGTGTLLPVLTGPLALALTAQAAVPYVAAAVAAEATGTGLILFPGLGVPSFLVA